MQRQARQATKVAPADVLGL